MLKKLVIASLSLCCVYLLPVQAQAYYFPDVLPPPPLPGDYSQTCSSCYVDANNLLHCACANKQGLPRNTILPDSGSCAYITNNNGQLLCTSWQRRTPYRRPSQVIDIPAGPIWNQSNARQICPVVCQNHRGVWTGQWTTVVVGKMSVCQCRLNVRSAPFH